MSNKRKWKVYTTDELRDRFQSKPGAQQGGPAGHHIHDGMGPVMGLMMDDKQGGPMPNLKRRNSAPPGMIHFPPGTFSAPSSASSSSSSSPHLPNHAPSHSYTPSSPHQQHELVTHARGSPTMSASGVKRGERAERAERAERGERGERESPYAMPASRLERRRASLPFLPSSSSSSSSLLGGPPSIEAYLLHLQQIPLASHDLDDDEDHHDDHPSSSSSSSGNPPLSPSHGLPSFQSLLQTIREDAGEDEEEELKDIAERANGSPHMQTSKTMPNYNINASKSPKQQHAFSFGNNGAPQEPTSPSSKFYKNKNLSKSNENLPSLSRMSISDIIS